MNKLFRILTVIAVITLLISFGYENILSTSAQAAGVPKAPPPVSSKAGITTVAVSPDGKILAGGNAGTQIDLWDVSTGKLIRTLPGHLGGAVTKVAFSPDGRILASAGRDSIVRLWDVATGQQLRQLQGHEAAVRALAFSPDGKTLVSGGEDTRILVWDVASGKLMNILSGHSDFVSSLAFSRDGKMLASGSEDTRIVLWDIATGQERQTLRGHSGRVTDIAFSPDGTTLVSASEDKTLRVWDVASGTQRQVLNGPTRSVRTVAFSPDGMSLVSGGDDNLVTLWDAKTGRVLRNLNGHSNSVTGVAFTPDSTQVVGGSADNQVILWGASNGQQMRVFNPSASPNTVQAGQATGGALSLDSAAASSLNAAAALAPTDGPGGPILVITTTSDPFSTYYAEILRTEGFNEFATADIGTVTATTLSAYDVVLLAHMPLTAAQVSMFSTWVNTGGNLIAMQPDKQLTTLLGLTDTASTLSNGYLLVDTTTQVGNGIVNQTIQFHGVADRYSLNGASSLATLYTNATTATTNPAVTLRTVGTGHAAAFVYDLARSIAYTRQGNPAWAGQERDGITPIRSDDLYYGAAAGDLQPDWVDLNKVSIPQADEQQRLLANLILNVNRAKKPLPRFWYFPRGFKAVVIMTGDDHANGGTPGRFDQYIADSPANCNVANWECVRSTSYVENGEPMTDAQAASYAAQGFEIGLHVTTNCLDWTPTSLASTFTSELSSWKTQFPSLPSPVTNRTHCIVWSDWSTQPQVELNNGMRLDTNYYYWPPTWITDRPGFFTGSGMPMRFVDLSGTMIDIYQATTQMTDESGQTYPYNIDTLLNNALGSQGYYGAFTVNAHTDTATSSVSDAVVASAQSHGVPIVSSKQMLAWIDGRNNSSFGSLAWNGTALSFTITPGAGATGLLQALVPMLSSSGVLSGLTLNGSPVSYTVQGIKGVSYAAFMANAGSYVATYSVDTTPPTVISTTPASGATGVNSGVSVSVTFSEPIDPTTVNGTTFALRDPSNALVSATVSYDSTTNRAILVPTQSLAFGTAYTASVLGGATDPRIKDLSGNALATTYSWSFTTAAAPPCPCSIWSGSATPQNPSVNDPNAVELGVKFQSDIDGLISGIRFYKGVNNTGTHVGSLWTSSGTLLAQATFSGESATGWQQVSFATPVAITANTVYVASYHTTSGNYAGDNNYFATAGVDNPPLHALRDGVSGGDGVYMYGATTAFPSNTYASSNYWVDVVFTLPGPTSTPTPTNTPTITPTPGNTPTPTSTPTPSNTPTFTPTPTSTIIPTATSSPCSAPANPIVAENCLPGNPASEWDISGSGDSTIQGFATDISVNRGGTISFKVNTNATSYRLDIYRLGYYGGMGARKITTLQPSATLPQNQPACLTDSTSGLIDCGNWGVSASWTVPANATSGIYIARLVRTDTGGASHIVFIVRDDASTSDLLFQTSDTTWQAYNTYGGNSLYVGGPGTNPARAYKVSYNRPITTRGTSPEDFLFNAEYPMVRWLEANGYNVSYFTGVDTDRNGSLITNHKVFLSVGHDEYWSGAQRSNVEAARARGVNLAFFSANEIFWKTRWENSIDGSGTSYRTLVCYKETHANARIDPLDVSPTWTWTGTWRDPRFSPPSDGGRPENAVTGNIFMVNDGATTSIVVPADDGKMRFWRNTSIATLATGTSYTLPFGTLGYEWDEDLDNGFRPAGVFDMSTTTVTNAPVLQDYGSTYASGTATHHLTLYRSSSGALVFGAGTVQWSWGLDSNHDRGNAPVDVNMQQATINLLADMNAQPVTIQPGMVAATASTDTVAPTSTITSPTNGSTVSLNSSITISGSAVDSGGGTVGGVEVSVDGGVTWHPVSGRASWSYNWRPTTSGSVTIQSRAVDDSGNLETPAVGITVTVGSSTSTCPCSIWSSSATPLNASENDSNAVEVGVKFTADTSGLITGIRFYKGSGNTGTHVGSLWTSSGTLLAQATFTNESSTGWQQVNFVTPVAITANTVYVASYHTSTGHYANDNNYFTSAGVDSPPLHALIDGASGGNGVYTYGATSAFPTSSYIATNYWVDVVFTLPAPSATPTPTNTPTSTPTPGNSPTPTPTSTPTNTPPPSPTPTPTNTPGPTPTPTNTPPPTPTPTNTPTPTATNTPTPTPVPGNTIFFSPSANAPVTTNAGDNNGYELNPTNAYISDGAFAQDVNSGTTNSTSCTNSGKDKQLYFNYGIGIPGTTVTGIVVRLDALVNGTTGSPNICVQLSWNGGSSWTAAKSTGTLTTSNATYILGSSADTWGHTWTTAQLNNTNFRVRVIDVASNTSRTFSLDWVAVQVFYR